EPPCFEGQRLCTRHAGVDPQLLRSRDHRLGRVDRPHPRQVALLERLREPSRAAPDLEDPLPTELPEPHERLVDLPPVRVDRPQLLVAGREPVEPSRHVSTTPSADCRSGFAPPFTSSGDPRSGNGTSIVSKSRGRTLAGKTS